MQKFNIQQLSVTSQRLSDLNDLVQQLNNQIKLFLYFTEFNYSVTVSPVLLEKEFGYHFKINQNATVINSS